jgi:hypothetical protein
VFAFFLGKPAVELFDVMIQDTTPKLPKRLVGSGKPKRVHGYSGDKSPEGFR